MDNKALEALTALANKLGTTAEYLWAVLVKQAPISGAIDLAMMVAWAVACTFLVRFVHRKTRGGEPEWEDDMARSAAWLCTGLTCAMAAMVISVELGGAITAIVNPEYWALRQILR